jgi:hypothetical protein
LVLGCDDDEGLKLALPFGQSASVGGVAENRSQHRPSRSHAILANTVGITPKGQLNITVGREKVRSPTDSCDTRNRIEAAVAADERQTMPAA